MLASKSGVSTKTLGRYAERPGAPNQLAGVKAVALATGVSPDWLQRGVGEMLAGQSDGGQGAAPDPEDDRGEVDDDEMEGVVEVPRYGHVGAGDARVPPKKTGIIRVSPVAYTLDFGEPPRVIGNRYAPSGRFGYFIIDGDSAAPVFFDRERVPVQMLEPERTFANDLLYVFRWQGEYQIKRLRLQRDGMIRASSLNPSIDPFEFHVDDDEDFAVIALARMTHKQQIYTALVGRFLRTDS